MMTRHIRSVLLLTGMATCPAALLFLFPSLLGAIFGVAVPDEAGMLFLRHWGLELGCVGALLMYAANHAPSRKPVVIAATVSKAGMVYLLLQQLGNGALVGLAPVIAFDGLCVALYATYLIQSHATRAPRAAG